MRTITYDKVKRKLWEIVVAHTRNKSYYSYIYRSYWHYMFYKNKTDKNITYYYAARPNPGAVSVIR